MEDSLEKKWLIKALWFGVIFVVAAVFIKYLLPFLMPFLLGFFIAYLLRPCVMFITRHSGMSKRGAAIVSATLLYLVIALIIWFAGAVILIKIEEFLEALPQIFSDKIEPFFGDLQLRSGAVLKRFSKSGEGIDKVIYMLEEGVRGIVSQASEGGIRLLAKTATELPNNLLAIIFTIISSVLICSQYQEVVDFILRQIPQRLHKTIFSVRDFLTKTIFKIIKTYLIIMLITFVMLCAGFFILKVENLFFMAGFIAVLDLMPVLGSGLILVPWSIYCLMGKDYYIGTGLIIVWAVISVVREFLEPRILGKQIGLNPLISLIAMYLGLRLAGFAGLIVAPVICLLLKYLQQNNIIKLYK